MCSLFRGTWIARVRDVERTREGRSNGIGEKIQKLFEIWESFEEHEEINKSTKRERGKLYQRENRMN